MGLDLDAHEQPSEQMKAEWKHFSRLDQSILLQETPLDDPRLPLGESGFIQTGSIPRSTITEAYSHLGPEYAAVDAGGADAPILYHPLLPGLLILPSLVPPAIQTHLLNTMIHRDLSNPIHQTNLHLHYDLPYPSETPSSDASSPPPPPKSFFSLSPESPPTFIPKDPDVHKPLTIKQALQRRLHWVTLGGQYDWTNRVYPEAPPPSFPADLSNFLTTLFPETLAQAAIVNFYTPGDTMMMHRDVSEEIDKGLVSLSFGCECLFMIAPSRGANEKEEEEEEKEKAEEANGQDKDKKKYLLLRLRSGDAIYMTNESRYAWHGVPKVMKGTCPDYLADWPVVGENGEFEEWKGWMQNKRINLNVRQMR